MQVHISLRLILVGVGLLGLGAYIAANARDLRPRKFILLSALFGVLLVLLIGGAYRTPYIGALLGVPTTSLQEPILSQIKAWVAITAAALSVYQGIRAKSKNPIAPHYVKGIAAILVVVSIGCYYRFSDLGYSNFYHRWEFYHYYLGAKYDRELGYERLYACTAVAQSDLGQGNEVRSRKLRDLAIDELQPASEVLKNPDECRKHFTPERWEAYKKDVNWFRHSSNIQYWNDMQKDHGYNPPPVWTVMGHYLASLQPAGDTFFKLLGLVDPLYFAGLFAAIWWAFGWRVFAVAILFWGTQLPAEYFWTGGAFLRQDWLFWLVMSACLIRKRYFALGGAAFAYSTLLRAFPGVLAAGWAVQILYGLWKRRTISRPHLRLLAGGAIATAVLVGASAHVAGWRAYPEFYKHIQVHNNTPLTNNMGLTTLIQHSWDGRMKFARDEKLLDPFGPWKQMRRDRLKAFLPFRALLTAAIMAAFAYVVSRRKSLWMALALSLPILITWVELTCYYYTMFILAALLCKFRRGVEQALICTAGVSQMVVVNRWFSYYYDDRYTAQSLVFVVFAVGLIFAFWPARKQAAAAQMPTASGGSADADTNEKTAAQA